MFSFRLLIISTWTLLSPQTSKSSARDFSAKSRFARNWHQWKSRSEGGGGSYHIQSTTWTNWHQKLVNWRQRVFALFSSTPEEQRSWERISEFGKYGFMICPEFLHTLLENEGIISRQVQILCWKSRYSKTWQSRLHNIAMQTMICRFQSGKQISDCFQQNFNLILPKRTLKAKDFVRFSHRL